MTTQQTSAFLQRASVEITPKQIDKIGVLSAKLPVGTEVCVALVDAKELEAQVAAVAALRDAGFKPIPHIPARFVMDKVDLQSRVAALTKAGATTILALGGGAPQPMGIYHSALQLLETNLFQDHGVTRIGIAGHPEGNSDISKNIGEAGLLQALIEKQAWLKKHEIEGFIATQFLFDAEPLAFWANQLRQAGVNLPIHVGVPGPATLKTLVRYAAMCGVGNSARFIRKQALNITRLLTVSEPTEFVNQLATLHFEKPELGIAAPHLYPFGGFDKLFDWLQARQA